MLDRVDVHDMLLVVGDFNARVGSSGEEAVIRPGTA